MPVRAVPASVETVHQVNALTDNEASSDAEVGCPCRVGNGALDFQGESAGSSPIEGRFAGRDLDGEFDPGSGRTLAACLTHASRTRSIQWQHWGRPSGERVSNT